MRDACRAIRFLALAGVANVVMLFLYRLPVGAITTLWPHPWPEDIVKRPYLTLDVRRSESR